jgi:two-component system LytT family response regulator
MKAVIIDDEKSARNLIEAMVKEVCSEITTIYKANELEFGVAIIKEERPDIVFLDIEMPRYSGLQILEFFEGEEINFQIIFVTAYDKYAIEAFKLSAIDYLLKPIHIGELKEAIKKAVDLAKSKKIYTKLEDLKQSFQQLALNTLALDVPKGIVFASYDDILYFEADGMYTKVFTKNVDTFELVSKPLKHFSDQLENNTFFYKCHRSYLINLKQIKQFFKQDGGYLLMMNQKNIPIAKNKKEEFLGHIGNIF